MVDLVDALRSCGALRYGEFTLASGKKSHYYVDIKRAVTRPEVLKLIVRSMAPHVSGHARIAGVELGAVPIAVALSLETSIPYVMIRKQARTHGTERALEGEINPGERVLLVEDVTTTGGSVKRAVLILRDAGAFVERVLCVVDRGEGAGAKLQEVGVDLLPLLRSEELLDSSGT